MKLCGPREVMALTDDDESADAALWQAQDDFAASLDAESKHLAVGSEAHVRNRAMFRLNLCAGALVYFVQCRDDQGPIKIGRTRDLQQRLATIRLHNPYPLRVLCAVSGGDIMERAMHKRFATQRISGEWFAASVELVKFATDLNRLLGGS